MDLISGPPALKTNATALQQLIPEYVLETAGMAWNGIGTPLIIT